MRKIKFRGKSVESGQWLYGSLIDRYDKKKAYIVSSGTSFIPQEVDKNTVGQFTGIVDDANGKDIYEGDVVEYEEKYQVKKKGLIFYSDFVTKFEIVKTKDKKPVYFTAIGIGEIVWCKVIGNIYDNKELLE